MQDRHAVGESLPIVDKAQNWDLLNATETTDGVTTLIFERAFNTCDDEDVVLSVINLEPLNLTIYAEISCNFVEMLFTKKNEKWNFSDTIQNTKKCIRMHF